MINEAKSSFSSLLTTVQPWYGTDGEPADTALTNSTYAAAMNQIKLPSTLFGYTNSSKTASVCSRLLAQSGLSCESYSLGAYDDVWLAALSILNCNANSGTCIQCVVTSGIHLLWYNRMVSASTEWRQSMETTSSGA